MNDTQKLQIKNLRGKGYSYGRIGEALGISTNTVKTYCRRHGLGGCVIEQATPDDGNVLYCQFCGEKVLQTDGRKAKKFCSDRCRNKWWNSHLDQVNRKANYECNCANCKKTFISYGNKNRKYCSHECYIEDRFGGGNHD